MGGIIVVIVLILIGALIAFITIKINNLKYRAKQQVLGKVGLGNADINASLNATQEQFALSKILETYPTLTEKQLKDTLYSYTNSIINLQNNGYMSDKVLSKMQNDNLLQKMRTMNFVRINIISFIGNKLSSVTIYTDGRDEYQITLMVSIQNNGLYIEHYDSEKGMVRGF